MIARHLFRHLGARQAPFLIACSLLFGLFQFLVCAAAGGANIGRVLEVVLSSLPPVFQNILTTQFPGGLTARGLLAFGWNHPVAHASGTAVAIVLASRAVAGEIETGAAELLLSQPLSRVTYFATYGIFALLALAGLSSSGLAGMMAGQAVFHIEPFPAGRMLALAVNYFLLQSTWFAIGLAFSASGREGGRIAGIGFLLALASYFAQAIGLLWSDAAFVLPWSLHHYFSPQGILLGTATPLRSFLTLLAVTSAGLGVAAWRFQRRDLP